MLPGWQDLPLLGQGNRHDKPQYHVPAGYLEDWTIPGAPWRDCRHQKYATRSHDSNADPPKRRAAVARPQDHRTMMRTGVRLQAILTAWTSTA